MDRLSVAVKVNGTKNWIKPAEHLKHRTDVKCRERYCNILDPSIKTEDWTADEDLKLVSNVEIVKEECMGKIKWSKVAELVYFIK